MFQLDRHPVHHQYPVVGQDQQVAAADLAAHDVTEPARREQFGEGPAEEVGREPEQPLGRVVGQDDPLAAVVAEHRLPDAVQHGLAFLQQARDLAEFQAERLALEPPGQAERGQHSDREDTEQVDGEGRQRAGQLPGTLPAQNPTETSPTSVCPSHRGVLPAATSPSVPSWIPVHGFPVRKDSLAGGSGSSCTGRPIIHGCGWEYRIPSAFVMTTNNAPVRCRAAMASRWASPPGCPWTTASDDRRLGGQGLGQH